MDCSLIDDQEQARQRRELVERVSRTDWSASLGHRLLPAVRASRLAGVRDLGSVCH